MKVFRLVFVFVTFFCRSRSNECDAVRCRREGSSGKMRIGHRPLMYQEMPYLVVFLNEGKPFCFGVLVKGNKVRDNKVFHNIVMTTCTCGRMLWEKQYQLGVGNAKNKYVRLDQLVTIRYQVFHHRQCKANNELIYAQGGNDFGYGINYDPSALERLSPRIDYAFIKSKDTSVITDHINSMMKNHESRCFGVGFGGYDFTPEPPTDWSGKVPEFEGNKKNLIHIYDYRLITDEECDKYMPKCCRSWGSLLVKGGIKSTGLHCAVRGIERSLCFGNMGSPIVCDGYLIGFFKGHMKCSPDDRNFIGPDMYVPLSHYTQWVFDELKIELPFVFDRPLPEPFHDTLQGGHRIDDIFPTRGGEDAEGGGKGEGGSGRGAGSEGGKGGKKKPGDEDDDDYDYYGASNKISPNIILTSLKFVLSIW